jgi:PAS domain S-box-containing protein
MIANVLIDHKAEINSIKRMFMKIFSLMSVSVLFIFATVYLVDRHDSVTAIIYYALGSLIGINYFISLRKENIQSSICILLIILFVMTAIIYIQGGLGGTGNLWIMAFPLIAYYLAEKPINYYIVFAHASVLMLLSFFMVMGYIESEFSWIKIRQTMIVYFVIILVSYLNESLKALYSKKMEESLGRMTTILDNLQDTYYRLDRGGNLVYVSSSINKILGYESEEVLKKEALFFEMSLKKRFIKELKKSEGFFNNFEFSLRNREGEKIPVLVNAQYILDDKENIVGIEGTVKEVQELKAAQAALYELTDYLDEQVREGVQEVRKKDELLVQQSRMAQMGEMIAMIAHQWRQPLSGITSTIADMRLKKDLELLDESSLDSSLIRIEELSTYLSGTINDFRNFFKSDGSKSIETLSYVVNNSIKMAAYEMDQYNIHLDISNNSQTQEITYANEVMQVLINILKNAQDVLIENTIESPQITINVKDTQSDIVIEVSDNGGGIEEEIMSKIFDPYFSTKDDKNGTGLGLYMSKTIIEDHCKGQIEVKNIDKGAKFTIRLPKRV